MLPFLEGEGVRVEGSSPATLAGMLAPRSLIIDQVKGERKMKKSKN
jgi:hypothetical protein